MIPRGSFPSPPTNLQPSRRGIPHSRRPPAWPLEGSYLFRQSPICPGPRPSAWGSWLFWALHPVFWTVLGSALPSCVCIWALPVSGIFGTLNIKKFLLLTFSAAQSFLLMQSFCCWKNFLFPLSSPHISAVILQAYCCRLFCLHSYLSFFHIRDINSRALKTDQTESRNNIHLRLFPSFSAELVPSIFSNISAN